MNSGIYEAMVERMNALEARITELEKKTSEPETAGGGRGADSQEASDRHDQERSGEDPERNPRDGILHD